MHNAYKMESYWDKPTMKPTPKERVICKHDGEIDSLNHIIPECTSIEQGQYGKVYVAYRETGPERSCPDKIFPPY